MNPEQKNCSVLMAAGNSSRFGTNKLLHLLGGRPLYRYTLDSLLAIVANWENQYLLVVTRYEEIRSEVMQWEQCEGTGRVRVVWSPESVEGASVTVKNAVLARRKYFPEATGTMTFFVADQPELRRETIEAYLTQVSRESKPVGSVTHRGEPGNPVSFATALEEELLGLQGDRGGRRVYLNHVSEAFSYEVGDELRDIDRREDLPVRKRIFLATPISGFATEEEYRTYRGHILKLIAALRTSYTVYCEAERVEEEAQYLSPEESVREDFKEVQACDVFVLLHPFVMQTSALMELGYAVACGKQIVLAAKREDLPYMAKGLGAAIIEGNLEEPETIEAILAAIC